MGPRDIQQILSLYAALMEEIKQRSDLVVQLCGKDSPLPPVPSFEFCQLQMRLISETFALACLTAHGDIPEVRSAMIQDTYKAELVFKRLTRLHPEFYPLPASGERKQDAADIPPDIPAGVRFFHFTPRAGDYLTKEKLIKSYTETGNYLHRGSIRKLIGKWRPNMDFGKTVEWNEGLGRLISPFHIIALADGRMMICEFNKKNVRCAIAERSPDLA